MLILHYFSPTGYWSHASWCRRMVDPSFDFYKWGAELEELGDRMAEALINTARK